MLSDKTDEFCPQHAADLMNWPTPILRMSIRLPKQINHDLPCLHCGYNLRGHDRLTNAARSAAWK